MERISEKDKLKKGLNPTVSNYARARNDPLATVNIQQQDSPHNQGFEDQEDGENNELTTSKTTSKVQKYRSLAQTIP